MSDINNASSSYNAAQAFGAVCANNVVNNIASQNHIVMSASNPGLPQDAFKRENTFTSSRYNQAPSTGSQIMKGLGSFFSGIGMVSKIVSFFYPPVAAVGSVAELAAPVMTELAGDQTPKPVKFTSMQKYNPWLR